MSDGDLLYIPERPENPKPLGRNVVWHDERNKDFPARTLPRLADAPVTRPWYTRVVYDQRGSSCTFQSAVGVLNTVPFSRSVSLDLRKRYDTEEERHAGYLKAQGFDPWPGGEPSYEGSSTDAPFKVLREEGVIREWRWIFGVPELQTHLRHRGPASAGTNWYESMFSPKADGTIEIAGDLAGGHAWRVIFDDMDDRRFLAVNSWGRTWGRNGRFWVPYGVMERLLGEQGEVATVVV